MTGDQLTECGFCEGGISGRYVGEGQFDEFDCPYCDGTGLAATRGERHG